MEGKLSKTMVKGKQNNIGLGGAMRNGNVYDAQSQDLRNRFYPISWMGVTMAAYGTPSFLNISSSVLKATGLTKLWFH